MDPSALHRAFLTHLCQTSPDPIGLDVASAEGCTITDSAGRRYLDFISGIGVANVGHRHPAVLAAIREQLDRYLHVMVYGEYVLTPQVTLVQQLAEIAPPPLSVTYLTNSGTEAVEGALKTARKFTRRTTYVAFDRSYHGDTYGAMSVMGRPEWRAPYEPLVPGVRFLPWNDPARLEGPDGIDDRVAAVIMEPIQAEGGVRLPTADFVRAVRTRCTAVGALLLMDEVVTGFGRTGRFFAVEHWGVTPDILILAKAMGGGLPLGGFLGRPDVMAVLSRDPPLSHLTTFGGHPLSCAAGLASLRVILDHRLASAAADTGARLQAALNTRVGLGGLTAVRGLGLLIGMEFETAAHCARFVERCRMAGLLLGWTLHEDRVVRLAPPLVLSADEMEEGLNRMERALR
ncbi:MAG TPA: aspartate aminotransferase family protein [Nitrospiria bacterium]|nr:aspartate aminotransferase family protein [Nitrospiria bacterium]